MVSMNSTLVETVSINYEDFNESFLTCGTCLCMYDGGEHTPKLLQCSHTVCLHCLTRIAASQSRDVGTFRCPICRELITVPRGGVAALPPSFLVNQLLDLMSRQRREVVPKCSEHINQELLFCETCDAVFCTLCTGGSHAPADASPACAEHTIIPFSIAIKRMSEILLYKANECIAKLTHAQEGVSSELQRLDGAKAKCLDQLNSTFRQVETLFERRKAELIAAVTAACQEKKKVLEEQQSLIEAEKGKVQRECEGLQYQVEVRNITQRIGSLNEKLEAASTLAEPRENAFLTCDFAQNDSLGRIEDILSRFGKVRTSTTFPSLCTAHCLDAETVVGLRATLQLNTVDYHGEPRLTGGDPITADILPPTPHNDNTTTAISTEVMDGNDGTYKIYFRPPSPGQYIVKLSVFERPIKQYPLYVDVTEHNNPSKVYGGQGSGKDEFLQPVAIAIDYASDLVYVVDAGNSRIKVLDLDLEFREHITNEGLLGRSCTGIAVTATGSLLVVNWRTKAVTEMTTGGQTVKQFTHDGFLEPMDICCDRRYGHVLVADNGPSCVFVFDADGKLLFQIGKKETFDLISGVCLGANGEVIVADSKIRVFNEKGDFSEEISTNNKGKSRYGGLAIDCDNRILVSRCEKTRNTIQVYSMSSGKQLCLIDSSESKLKRPSGMVVTRDHHVIVVDLGNDCIKKYRYW